MQSAPGSSTEDHHLLFGVPHLVFGQVDPDGDLARVAELLPHDAHASAAMRLREQKEETSTIYVRSGMFVKTAVVTEKLKNKKKQSLCGGTRSYLLLATASPGAPWHLAAGDTSSKHDNFSCALSSLNKSTTTNNNNDHIILRPPCSPFFLKK